MNELEEKLNALLSNPQLMQQVAGLAQAMGSTNADTPRQSQEDTKDAFPSLDPKQMQFIMQAMNQNGVDRNQKALLHALTPYLSSVRINKLERAMRAAKIAGTASQFINSGGVQLLTGR